MKQYLLMALLLPMLAGCVTMERLEEFGSSAEKLIEDSLDSQAMATAPADEGLLTKTEAERLALEYAGVNRGQISLLRTKYQWDDGRHLYEIEFRQGPWFHELELDARTGQVLSWEKQKDR